MQILGVDGLVTDGASTPAWSGPGSARSRSASPPSCRAPESRSPTARPQPHRPAHATDGATPTGPPIAATTSSSAARLCPLTSASNAEAPPPSHRRVARTRRAQPRIDPHDPMREPGEPLHLASHELRVAALPPIGQDHDDGATRHPAPPVAVVERLQCAADARPTRPVGRGGGGAPDRPLGVARRERPRQPRRAASRTRTSRRRGPLPAAHARNWRYARRVGLHRARRCRTAAPFAGGRTRRRRRAIDTGSPPVRRLARSVRRTSTRAPWRSRRARRVRRSGVAIANRDMSRYSAASSPGVERVEPALTQDLLVTRCDGDRQLGRLGRRRRQRRADDAVALTPIACLHAFPDRRLSLVGRCRAHGSGVDVNAAVHRPLATTPKHLGEHPIERRDL